MDDIKNNADGFNESTDEDEDIIDLTEEVSQLPNADDGDFLELTAEQDAEPVLTLSEDVSQAPDAEDDDFLELTEAVSPVDQEDDAIDDGDVLELTEETQPPEFDTEAQGENPEDLLEDGLELGEAL
ncbi:MAG: hypothetical protein JRH15_04540, partial [Deltaproteobacteria bacterium]|nr:hypothetical protein [Deltaproteobacteria bacterium]